MCGIAGILDLNRKRIEPKKIKKMIDTLAHRGPNGEGIFVDGAVGLGHCRLSILDLSNEGSQPMKNSTDKLTITHNGEVYNYIELKKELGTKKYKSTTDTEVLLRAYEKWGSKCVEKFNGIFAFAIWDKQKKQLFAARDHAGVKPLYYTIYKSKFYFASEIKALLAAGVPAKPNDKIIHDYLVHGFYDHNQETFFKDINQLMPGHRMTIRAGKIRIERYWHLPDKARTLSYKSDKEYEEKFLQLLQSATKLQLRSDVPVGFSVSGGLDSSLLVSMANQASKGKENFDLFHFAYKNKKYDQELPYVNKLAQSLGWQNTKVAEVQASDLPKLTKKIMWHEEQPYPGTPTYAWHKLYEMLGKTNTIVTLEGHGGDEMFAGYDYYFGSFLLDVMRTKGMENATDELQQFASVREITNAQANTSALNGIEAYFRGGISADTTKFASTKYFNQEFVNNGSGIPTFEEPFDSYLANIQYRELLHTKLPRVLRSVDRESMAFGRELRVPILDHRLIEFAFSLPLNQRIRKGNMRHVMRRAAKRSLPAIISNTPKRSLPNPQREWFQKDLKPWITKIIESRSFKARPYFNHKEVQKEYARYGKEKNPQNAFHIWQWLSIELWMREFID